MTFGLDILACRFISTLSKSGLMVKVKGQSSRSQEEKNIAKVAGATSSEGFLVLKNAFRGSVYVYLLNAVVYCTETL